MGNDNNNNIEDFNKSYTEYQKSLLNKTENRKLPIFDKRFRVYNPDQIIFTSIDPEKIFPKGCYERFLVEAIKKIDISNFAKRDRADLGGRNEYNPKSILAILFYGISEGVFSSVKISESCLYDTRYIFVSGGETPEHSTISRFINNYFKEIQAVFTEILYIADNLGYLDYKLLAIDGSKFKAYASERFTGTLEDFRKKKNKLESKIILALEKQKNTESEEERNYWKNKEDDYKKNKKKIEDFLENAEEIYNKDKKEIRQNITDKDCRVMKGKKQEINESYNSQITVDEKYNLITACEVTNECNDYNMLSKMIEKNIDTIPDTKKEELKESRFVFDNGYYSADNLQYCDENEIDAYISDDSSKYIYTDKKDDDYFLKKKKITSRDCKIEMKNGQILLKCPNEKELKFIRKCKDGETYSYKYKTKHLGDCGECKYESKCVNQRTGEKIFTIRANIIENADLIDKMHKKLRTDSGRMIYSRRMPTVERLFGHVKKNLRFDRFPVIGLKKVKTRWSMICSAYNLKRIFILSYSLK